MGRCPLEMMFQARVLGSNRVMPGVFSKQAQCRRARIFESLKSKALRLELRVEVRVLAFRGG